MAQTKAQRATLTRDQRAAQDARVYSLRLSGANYRQISAAVEITESMAYKAYQREHARRQPSDEEVRQARDLDLMRIDRLMMEAWSMATGTVSATVQAKDKLKAIETATKLMERRARMLGYDAPQKIDARVDFRGLTEDDTVTQLARLLGKPQARAEAALN